MTTTHSRIIQSFRVFLFTQRVRVTVRLVTESHSGTLTHPGKFHIMPDFSASVLTFSLYEVNGHRLAANVSWAVISFMIIFPLTSSLSEASRAKRPTLEHVATFKATLVSYFYGHRDWDWYAPGHLIGSQKSNITRKERGRMLLQRPRG